MLRRYAPPKPSRGTVIPPEMRIAVFNRDGGCIGRWVNFPTLCSGPLEVDHVRASHGMGMKSETAMHNLVALCGSCHRWKTENGRKARPLLLAYLERLTWTDCGHVDGAMPGCAHCDARARRRADPLTLPEASR